MSIIDAIAEIAEQSRSLRSRFVEDIAEIAEQIAGMFDCDDAEAFADEAEYIFINELDVDEMDVEDVIEIGQCLDYLL